MNFSDNDLTGILAEQDVERLFTSWRWTTGKDRLDIGYDISVVPDISVFKGARFLVQSKGTSKRKKGAIVAQVKKARLRQYAENPHPVFIVRVAHDGVIYWIHAQEWAKRNIDKLKGDGFSGVKFDKDSILQNKEKFVLYLKSIMRPVHELSGTLKKISDLRSRYLSEIDPRFTVRVSAVDGKEIYEVMPTPGLETSHSKIRMKLATAIGNAEKLKEVFDFGLPASVDVDEFIMENSPLFDEIGLTKNMKGNIEITPNNISKGIAFLRPGVSHSITAAEFSIPVKIYSGKIRSSNNK